MKRTRFAGGQSIGSLDEREVGAMTADLACKHGVLEPLLGTCTPRLARPGSAAWIPEAERLKLLEDENAELRLLLSEQMLDGCRDAPREERFAVRGRRCMTPRYEINIGTRARARVQHSQRINGLAEIGERSSWVKSLVPEPEWPPGGPTETAASGRGPRAGHCQTDFAAYAGRWPVVLSRRGLREAAEAGCSPNSTGMGFAASTLQFSPTTAGRIPAGRISHEAANLL